ncbi:trace amine-associated receptor 1-like [Electrophorus electricus]|uniref:trace amine-associated receptor 1-like n=1 Tax=Electrophorus electricus TaxID=8005 RepID=UPI000F09AB09|nr:trace amine-associated receptor 1-like [Electrophorus electricus]
MGHKSTLNHSVILETPTLCYASVTGSCLKTVYPKEVQSVLYVLFGFVSLLTFLGNLLVIITIIHFKQLHTPTNYLVLSLAVADLFIGGLVMPPSMIRSVETCWYLGTLFCKIHTSLDVTMSTASILNLCIISVDRYYAVCHPLLYHSKMTTNMTLFMIIVSWTLSVFVGFGMIFLELGILGVEDFYYNNIACEGGCVLFLSKTAGAVFTVLCFYIPAVVMVSIYLKIFHIAQRQARVIQCSQIKTQQHTVRKTEMKATKTLAIVIGVFLVVWTPFFICALIDPFIGHVIPPILFDFFTWVGYVNSTCNPVVYAFFYSWFRKSFRIILMGQIFQSDSSRIKLF